MAVILRQMRYWFFFLLTAISCSVFGQNPDQKLDYNDLNTSYLEHLVKVRIDEFRTKKGLPKLKSDSLLIDPATDHTEWMKANNKLSHFQERGEKHNPQRRFEYYEINHVLAGENVEFIPINSLLKVTYQKELVELKTYDDLARAIALGWKHSKPHYANIISKDFTITAIAIRVDNKNERIWATQVFGKVIGSHPLTKTNQSFPYESMDVVKKKSPKKSKPLKPVVKYNYGIKKPVSFNECPRELNNKLDLSNLKLQVTRDKVLLCVYDLNKIKRLFSRGKDGLAVELISFSNAFGCGTYAEVPNRRNGLSNIDGLLLKPVYRNNLLKQIAQLEEENRQRKKEKGEQRCNYIELGNTPVHLSGKPMEARLYFVQNKVLCTQIQFFGYCGELLRFKPKELPLRFNLPAKEYVPQSDTFELKLSVAFEKGSTEINSLAIDSLIEQIKGKELEVKSVQIEAFASIEGTVENNQTLFENRTKQLINRLNKFQNRRIEWTVNATENWPLFYDQIIGTKWFYLNSLSRAKIRNEVNKPINLAELEPLLAKQRIAEIKIIVVPELNNKWKFKLAQNEWNKLITTSNFQNVSEETVVNLENLQLYFYNSYENQPESAQQWIQSIYVPGYSKKISLLRYRYFMFQIQINGVAEPIETVEQFKKLNSTLQSSEVDYNIKSIIAANAEMFDEKTKIPLIKSLLKQAEMEGVESSLFQELELWYHIEMANLVFGSQNKKGRNKSEPSLGHIREQYLSAQSTSMDSITLASYFILFEKFDWATELLKPIAFDSLANENKATALELYLRHCISTDLEGRKTEMQFTVLNAFEELGQRKWCRLFFTPCAVPYEVFDYPTLRSLYCEACQEFITVIPD